MVDGHLVGHRPSVVHRRPLAPLQHRLREFAKNKDVVFFLFAECEMLLVAPSVSARGFDHPL